MPAYREGTSTLYVCLFLMLVSWPDTPGVGGFWIQSYSVRHSFGVVKPVSDCGAIGHMFTFGPAWLHWPQYDVFCTRSVIVLGWLTDPGAPGSMHPVRITLV